MDNKINRRLEKWLEIISGLKTPKILQWAPPLAEVHSMRVIVHWEDCLSLSLLLRSAQGWGYLSDSFWGQKQKVEYRLKKWSTDSPRTAWVTSKVGVNGKVKDCMEKPRNVLFYEKLSLQVPEKVESQEILEIFE